MSADLHVGQPLKGNTRAFYGHIETNMEHGEDCSNTMNGIEISEIIILVLIASPGLAINLIRQR